MIFSKKKKVLSALMSLAMIGTMVASVPFTASADTTTTAAPAVGVSYTAHVQSFGDLAAVTTGLQGTEGKSKRVEALSIKLTGAPTGASITYQVQGQSYGWQDAKSDGVQAGTTGKSKRIEALKITINGLAGYEVQYRAHVQSYGDSQWVTVKNGTAIADAPIVGTVGQSKRIEAYEVKLVSTNPEIVSAAATGVKTVTVKFNGPVDTTKAVLAVKKGAAIYGSTVAWNTAKDTATLTTIVNLPAADYTVEATGLTATTLTKAFTVAAEVATKIEVTSKTVALADSATIAFKVSNQYGEDMKVLGSSAIGLVVSGYNTTKSQAVMLTTSTADDKITFPADFASNATPAKLGDVIRVTIAYAGLTTQANVTVTSLASSATLAFGTVAPLTNDARIMLNKSGYVVPYTLFDQYGVAATLVAHTADQDTVPNIETISGVQFISSNPAVVDVDTFAVDAKGKLTFATTGTDGTAIITAVINASGAVSQFSVTVNKAAAVDSLVISAPSALVAAGETVTLPVSATDQFGVAIKASDISGVTFTSSVPAVVANGSTITAGKLNVTALAAGTTVLTGTNAAGKVVGTVTIVVEAKAYAAQITAVSFAPNFEVSATKTMAATDFTALDQYGRVIPSASLTFAVTAKDAATVFNALAGTDVFTAGATAGSQTFTLTATFGGKTTPGYDFTLNVIAAANVTSFSITAVPTILAGGDAAHQPTLVLVGKTAAGDTVVLNGATVTNQTSSDESIAKVNNMVVSGIAKGTATVTVWNGTTVLATTTITVSDAKAVATSVKFLDTAPGIIHADKTADFSAASSLEVKDQYGVVMTSPAGMFTSSNANIVLTAGAVTTNTAVAGETVTIGFVTSNGLVATKIITVS